MLTAKATPTATPTPTANPNVGNLTYVNVGKKICKKDANNVEFSNVSCPLFNSPKFIRKRF